MTCRLKNLAGQQDCDAEIRRELSRARIPEVSRPIGRSEVPASVSGQLGSFCFSRAWSYWIAEGDVPLSVALELYEDPVGKTDIRVGGHCACPHPLEYGTDHFDESGRELVSAKYNKVESLDRFIPDWREKYVIVEDPRAHAHRSIVRAYHIDSELGLRVFADAIRKHGLDLRPRMRPGSQEIETSATGGRP